MHLQGCGTHGLGRHWVALEWVQSIFSLLRSLCAWLLAFALHSIVACTAATLNLSLSLLAPHLLLLHHHPVPPSHSLFSRVHVPALGPRSSAFYPAATERQKKSISSPPAPPSPSPPTASSPPPAAAPCDALPAFLLCPASAPQRALRNETTPPRPRLYLLLREQLRPLANAAVSIPTPA